MVKALGAKCSSYVVDISAITIVGYGGGIWLHLLFDGYIMDALLGSI